MIDTIVDSITIKKILTFKSGQFVFSNKYDKDKLQPLLIQADILYKTVMDLPLLPEFAAKLEDEFIRKSIFGTAAIEGNPLNQKRVNELISQSEQPPKQEAAEVEIYNLKKAYDFVKNEEIRNSSVEVREAFIQKLHGLITQNIDDESNRPGEYRNHIVKVGDQAHGGVYTPPKILADIKNLMGELMLWINSAPLLKEPPMLRAALLHYHFGLIHPFADGNGRTARLLEAWIMQCAGIKYVPVMLSNYYYRNINNYYWAFSKSIKNKENDVLDFIEFVLTGIIESLEEVKERIMEVIRKLTLRDHYATLRDQKVLSRRQYDLLILLLDYEKPFLLKDLFKIAQFKLLYDSVSERTARRDLKFLQMKQLVASMENNTFKLNLRHLS